jgi:glycosyltransferase involved in cell wall biosynthesis
MTSLSEGLSMTMIEGMMLSTPVIITRTSGALDYVIDGDNGLLIDTASSEAIVKAVQRLKNDPIAAAAIAAAGRATYEKHFSSENVALSFLGAVDGTGETA